MIFEVNPPYFNISESRYHDICPFEFSSNYIPFFGELSKVKIKNDSIENVGIIIAENHENNEITVMDGRCPDEYIEVDAYFEHLASLKNACHIVTILSTVGAGAIASVVTETKPIVNAIGGALIGSLISTEFCSFFCGSINYYYEWVRICDSLPDVPELPPIPIPR